MTMRRLRLRGTVSCDCPPSSAIARIGVAEVNLLAEFAISWSTEFPSDFSSSTWQQTLFLSNPLVAWEGRDGRGLSCSRYATRPICCLEGSTRRTDAESGSFATIRAGGTCSIRTESSKHHYHPRDRQRRLKHLHRYRIYRRRITTPGHAGRADQTFQGD